MQRIFKVYVAKPSSWQPPFIEENEEVSQVPLTFRLVKDEIEPPTENQYHYVCAGCLSAGGCVGDLFFTSSLPESAWPFGDEGIPIPLVHEMCAHSRQHEIMWRWAINRIPKQVYDK